MKRLALYTLYDKNGIVKDYVLFYLKELKSLCNEIMVVINGEINKEGIRRLNSLGVKTLCRENNGFDFSAWRAGLDCIGWNIVKNYDELILCNCSVYGPIFSLHESFDKMSKQNCDFWGMTEYRERKEKLMVKGDSESYIRTHLQSYFLVFHKNVIQSEAFQKWWSDLKSSDSFEEEVYEHETKFTQYLLENGFNYLSYYNSRQIWNLSFDEAISLVENRMPFVKRKLFTQIHGPVISQLSVSVLQIIRKISEYDENFIWNDLVGTKSYKHLEKSIRKQKINIFYIKIRIIKYKLFGIFSLYYRIKLNKTLMIYQSVKKNIYKFISK